MIRHAHITALTSALLAAGIAAAALGLAACEEPADGDEALKRQLEEQAAAQPPRAAMSFGYYHELEGIDEGGPVRVQAAGGAQIEVTEAHLVVSALEAHLCEPELAERDREGLFHPLESLVVGEAHAHVPSSATRLGIPFVEDLFERSRARVVGEIAPPLGKYCRLYAVLSPADDDVLNLGRLDSEEIDQKTLLLRGRWRERADAQWQPFESASSARRVVEMAALDPNTGERPLTIDDPSQTKMLLLDKTVSPALFDGLTTAALDDESAADLVLERLIDQLHIRTFKNNK